VILVDANLLVYAHVSSFGEHDAAREWLDGKLAGPAPVGVPWESALAFARLVSNPRVFARPLTVAEAWKQVVSWLSCPAAWIPQPSERHQDVLDGLLRAPGLRASHVPDAHLAALAIEHGLVLCSTDGDFARFDGLRWENPLRG
jgi:toxin-antitoxin system PIN domain toxin